MRRLLWLAMICAALAGCAQSTVFNVNTTTDLLDDDPGDGDCAAANGQCSLRAAIQEANESGAGSNIEINLVSTGTYELTLDANDSDGFVITPPAKAIRISGCCAPGLTTIQPQGLQSRIFTIEAGGVTIERVRLTGAASEPLGMETDGGAVRVDGSSELFVDRVVVEGNAASVGRGAGIYVESGNLNIVQITNSTFRDNTASNAGVGGAGGVDGHASFRIVDTLFQGNEGSGGALQLRDAMGVGGPPRHEVIRSTFRDNDTGNSGGGGGMRIDVEDDSVLVSNSTFSGNQSATIGGGLSVLSGNVDVEHSTFSENRALDAGHAVFAGSGSEVRLRNNLIVENASPSGTDVSCSGTHKLILDGFNLIEGIDDSCDFLDEGAVDQDDIGAVGLAVFGYTESPIGHHPLNSTSPAIDHGPPSCVPADQLGNFRPIDGDNAGGPGCDTGAIEFQGD